MWVNAHPEALAVVPLFAAYLILRPRPFLTGILIAAALATRLQVLPIAVMMIVFGGWRTAMAVGLGLTTLYGPPFV